MPRRGLDPSGRRWLCECLIGVLVKSGVYALKAQLQDLGVRYDSGGGLLTEVDFAVSRMIQEELAAIDIGLRFSGEEVLEEAVDFRGLWAVIDGIDGTRNYRDGNYGWCISVGIVEDGVTTIGVVHDPYVGKTYAACLGQGATSIERGAVQTKLCVPSQLPMDFSFSVGSFRTGGSTEKKNRIVSGFKSIGGREREWGCVALSICGVARGGLGAFVQANSLLHDHVAATLIAKEAGASVVEKPAASSRVDVAVFHPSLRDRVSSVLEGNW